MVRDARPGPAFLLIAAQRSQEAAHRIADRGRNLGRQCLARELRRPTVGLEKDHTVVALSQVLCETHPLVLRQRALDIVETEVDQLLTVNHGVDSVMFSSSDGCRLPGFRNISQIFLPLASKPDGRAVVAHPSCARLWLCLTASPDQVNEAVE